MHIVLSQSLQKNKMSGRNAKWMILALLLWHAVVQAFRLGGWQRGSKVQRVTPLPSLLTNDKVSSKNWIESVFDGMKPSRLLIHRTDLSDNYDEDNQCIINNPKITLANPLLGLNLESLTKTVRETSNKEPGTKTKPLLATVRGIGGGKTRLLEEIRRNLQLHHSVLPIAITFNTHTAFDTVEFDVPSAAVSAALSIITRMASVFFDQPFGSVKDAMSDALPLRQPKLEATDLYTSFVQLMRQQMQDAGCPVETIVLMIDETVRLQSQLLEKYPRARDPLSALRHVLLDQTPNAALVLSSLEIQIDGATDSGRAIKPLLQCEALDPDEIVTRWWGITDSQLQHRLKLIAAVLCDLPRAVEMANTYIQRHRAEISQPSFTAELVQAVTQAIEERYQGATNPTAFPSAPLLKAMLFKSKYKVEREVTQAIRDSLLTNVLDHEIQLVSMKRNEPVLLTPRVNLFMLAIRTGDPRSFSGRFLELLRHVIHTTVQSTDAEGDLLEEHTALMLNARVGVSMYSGSTVTLAELLGLGPTGVNSPLRTKIMLTADMASEWTGHVQTLKYRSNTQASKFLKEIEAIEVSAEMPIALRFSAPGDSADLFVKVYDATAPAKCQYVVLENKSEQETSENANQTTRSFVNEAMKPKFFPKKGKQAKRVCAVMAQLNASTAYVYFTTHAVEQSVYKPPLQPNVMWVYGGREVVKNFMGPLWDLHRTYREGLFKRCGSDQKRKQM